MLQTWTFFAEWRFGLMAGKHNDGVFYIYFNYGPGGIGWNHTEAA